MPEWAIFLESCTCGIMTTFLTHKADLPNAGNSTQTTPHNQQHLGPSSSMAGASTAAAAAAAPPPLLRCSVTAVPCC